MNVPEKSKLEALRADYERTRGESFEHFFCPILWRDENVELCRAHIVNQAFQNSAPDWTVQRKDVDNFYGGVFEGEFHSLSSYEKGSTDRALTDKRLSKRLRPQILLNDKPVDYFFANKKLPSNYTRLDFEHDGKITHFGLKLPPQDMLAAADQKWEVLINQDFRIPAFASLIKAAHLTLFELLGYRYALSLGGHYIGKTILGDFFDQNRGKKKNQVLKAALEHFREFAPIVRPLQANTLNLQGTISDKLSFLCGLNHTKPWAFITFVRTSNILSAVMMPIMDNVDSVAQFQNFLQNDNETLRAALCRFEEGVFKIDPKSFDLIWPKTGVLYP